MNKIDHSDTIKDYIFSKARVLGLREADLALCAGITRGNINKWKNGHQEIRLSNFLSLCDGLGIDLPNLIANPNPVKIIDGTNLTDAGLEAAKSPDVALKDKQLMLDSILLTLPWENIPSSDLCRYKARIDKKQVTKGLYDLADNMLWAVVKPVGKEIAMVEGKDVKFSGKSKYSKNTKEGWAVALHAVREALEMDKRSK